jgi:nicotinamide phosphoribosyltransferase
MSVESTDPKVFWIVSWLETALVRLWYPITVATQSRHIRQIVLQYLEETADDPQAEINFKLHDFGSRGVSSQETAAIGGAAHLATGFMGSDTIAGIYTANKYYNDDMSGFSIPASEHSTMTMWGKENEAKAYSNMIEVYKNTPGGLFACVSDSYDIYNAVENIWGDELKDDVLAADATLVIRPDSGDPVEVITRLCHLIEKKFGAPYNTKGYKVFNKVKLIQGDGVDPESINAILKAMKDNQFSASNIAFGSGGALLQKMNRDTQKFAFKCSYAKVDGRDVNVFKQPVTAKFKKSKKGKLDLVENIKGEVTTTTPNSMNSIMVDVFENGKILKEYSLKEVRELAAKNPRKQQL